MTHFRGRIRLLTVPLAAAGLIVAGAMTAWAHVEVEADPATAGASDVTLTFHVPNEEAPAVTTAVTFVMPPDHLLVGVTAKPQNGFKATTVTRHLAVAVPGAHGPVSDVAAQVTFSGGKISGKDEKPFVLHIDRMPPGVRALTFKALQRYSNRTTVAWIEVAADGGAEPEHPAPVLKLAAQPASASSTLAPVVSTSTARPASGTKTAAAPKASTSSASGSTALPLVLGSLALVMAVFVLVLRRTRSRRN
ncbi:MAG: hypothetical protein QOE58_2436 [Actinomycetota bacterium]|jgi:uncharacterized protein YcnI|nr:hypothetical protein [Actinomycetota bacterium]